MTPAAIDITELGTAGFVAGTARGPKLAGIAEGPTLADRNDPRSLLDEALRHMVAVGASDLHLKAGSRPRVRTDGELRPAPINILTAADCEAIASLVMPPRQWAAFDSAGEADFALVTAGLGRFRVNAFRERDCCALAIRTVPSDVPSVEQLGLLPAVQRLAALSSGLVVIAGKAGSGKTTTLAWLVDRINETRAANIVSIEDPIEYVHLDKRSIVHQREVGADTADYPQALRRVLRQDPDVIVIGEVRDVDTARTALAAAHTGHLVLTTLHATTTADTIDRIVELYEPFEQRQARLSLAGVLRAVVCQRLVPSVAAGRALAQEVLLCNAPVAQRIVDPGFDGPSIDALVERDDYLGMISFDQHLLSLWESGAISLPDAMAAATNPHNLRVRVLSTTLGPEAQLS